MKLLSKRRKKCCSLHFWEWHSAVSFQWPSQVIWIYSFNLVTQVVSPEKKFQTIMRFWSHFSCAYFSQPVCCMSLSSQKNGSNLQISKTNGVFCTFPLRLKTLCRELITLCLLWEGQFWFIQVLRCTIIRLSKSKHKCCATFFFWFGQLRQNHSKLDSTTKWSWTQKCSWLSSPSTWSALLISFPRQEMDWKQESKWATLSSCGFVCLFLWIFTL